MNLIEALTAFWQGENVQTKHETDSVWVQLADKFPTIDIACAKTGFETWQFRVAPKTILIGGVECEAPVREPEAGQTLYWIDLDYAVHSKTYREAEHRYWVLALQHGDCFATPEAAWAARNAITKLLTSSGS